MNEIIVCGDSYGTGVGLPEETCIENSFGGLVSKKLNSKLRVFARSGICNFGIYLQVKKVVEEYKDAVEKPTVLISLTNHSRILVTSRDLTNDEVDLSNMDYLNSKPYSKYSKVRRTPDFYLNKPLIFSQTVMDVCAHLENRLSGASHESFSILPKYKLEALKIYLSDLYSDPIKEEYDSGLVAKMHLMLKKYNIPHIIMCSPLEKFYYIDELNLLHVDWKKISDENPDVVGSSHCNEMGHEIVANSILNKMGYNVKKNLI